MSQSVVMALVHMMIVCLTMDQVEVFGRQAC